jgi:hypothetical protein
VWFFLNNSITQQLKRLDLHSSGQNAKRKAQRANGRTLCAGGKGSGARGQLVDLSIGQLVDWGIAMRYALCAMRRW